MASSAFATADELRVFIGGDQIETVRAQRLVDFASAAIRRWTDQTLSRVLADVETFNPTDDTVLILSQRPVTAITQILEDGVVLPLTEFTFEEIGTIRKNDETAWDALTEVTYDHGFETTSDTFEEIKALTLQIAARAFTLNKASEFDEFSRTVSESAGFAPDLIVWPAEKQLLDDLGKVGVG